MVAGASTELLVDVLETKPLRLHASLHHSDAAQEVAWVPRLLLPAGAFIRVSVRDAADERWRGEFVDHERALGCEHGVDLVG